MRAALVALVLLMISAPLATAQAPTPEEAVALACATVGSVDPDVRDAIPVCPRQDPAGPAQAEEETADEADHDHGTEPAAPEEAARELSDEATDTAQGSAQDPQSAPGRAAGLVATVRQWVEDFLGVVEGAETLAVDVGISAGDAWNRSSKWVLDAARGGGVHTRDTLGNMGLRVMVGYHAAQDIVDTTMSTVVDAIDTVVTMVVDRVQPRGEAAVRERATGAKPHLDVGDFVPRDLEWLPR